jgi:fermentation-respiration switch protein FrsA (DUF1100 family)
LAAFAFQRSLIFAGKRFGPAVGQPRAFPNAQRVALQTSAGRVDALYLPARTASARESKAPAFLFAHGNAELIEDWPDWFESVRPPEMAALLVEFPGYGWSEGEPSGASAREALMVAHDWLTARPEIDGARIVGYGRSLGGGVMGALVGKKPLAALVLSSTFTSLRPFAWGMFVPPFLLEDALDTLGAVRRFEGPILVVHAEDDELIPYAHGKELAAASPRATLLPSSGGHNQCPPDPVAYASTLAAFLAQHGVIQR